MLYTPRFLEVGGKDWAINADFRPCIAILQQFERNDLTIWQKYEIMVGILFEDPVPEEHFEQAVKMAIWFLNCGEEDNERKQERVFSWTQDERFILSGVDKTAGTPCRSLPFLHWWDFVNLFMEMEECTFSSIVYLRRKMGSGKLSDSEMEWYLRYRKIVRLEQEDDLTPEERRAKERFTALLNGKEE